MKIRVGKKYWYGYMNTIGDKPPFFTRIRAIKVEVVSKDDENGVTTISGPFRVLYTDELRKDVNITLKTEAAEVLFQDTPQKALAAYKAFDYALSLVRRCNMKKKSWKKLKKEAKKTRSQRQQNGSLTSMFRDLFDSLEKHGKMYE